jgi:hypothetical protein
MRDFRRARVLLGPRRIRRIHVVVAEALQITELDNTFAERCSLLTVIVKAVDEFGGLLCIELQRAPQDLFELRLWQKCDLLAHHGSLELTHH